MKKNNTPWHWPYLRQSDGPEYSCRHGVGHSNGVHGCDGCCSDPNFPGRTPTIAIDWNEDGKQE
jgi:hypothetical protein